MDSSAVMLFSFANLCYFTAYVVKDILWLRIFSIGAALMTFPYFIVQSNVMYSALFWQSCFAAINIYHVVLLLWKRRPVDLSDKQQQMKDMVFRHLTSREVKTLLQAAKWHTAKSNEPLISQGQDPQTLYLLKSGKVDIVQKDAVVAYRGPGSFLGELNYITGALPNADVKFSMESEYLSWDKTSLETLLHKNTDLKNAFEALLSNNIASKLGSNDVVATESY